MQINSLDDLSTEKEIKLFGKTTSLKFQRLKILIIGLDGLGLEILRHIITQNPDQLGICDQEDKIKYAEKYLKQFSTATTIQTHDQNFMDQEFLKIVDRYDLIVICDIPSLKLPIRISNYLREKAQIKRSQGVIWACTFGFICLSFSDFGENFKIFDRDGEQPFPFQVQNVSQGSPGIVKVHPSIPHNFQTGDFVQFHGVEGMSEINGNESRPIKVISQYEFSIEDTSQFKQYEKGGLVQLTRVPFKYRFNQLEKSILNPLFEKNDQNTTIYSTLISILRCLDNQIPLEENHVIEQSKGIYNELLNDHQFNEQLSRATFLSFNTPRIPVITFFGGIISMEIIKFTGKYRPNQSIFVQFLQDIKIDDTHIKEKLSKLQILLIGCGGTGCEVLRMLARMNCCNLPEYKISILDDEIVRKYTQLSHFWFKPNTTGQDKVKVASLQAQEICQNMNIEQLRQKIEENPDQINQYEFIFQSINSQQMRQLIFKKCQQHKKVLFDQNLNGLKATSQIILPNNQQELNIDLNLKQIYNIDKETYKKFPFLPLHSILWAKDIFEQSFIGFVNDFQKYLQNPQEYLKNQEDTELALLKSHIISRITRPDFNLTLDKILSLSKELFDVFYSQKQNQYHFDYRVQQLLVQYPGNTADSIWGGYKRAPIPIKFDYNKDQHIIYIQITTLLISKIFNIDAKSIMKPEFVIDKVLQMKESYWSLQSIQQPFNINLSDRYKPVKLNFDEDSIRSLYVHCIHSLTNLRSQNYQIPQLHLYQQKQPYDAQCNCRPFGNRNVEISLSQLTHEYVNRCESQYNLIQLIMMAKIWYRFGSSLYTWGANYGSLGYEASDKVKLPRKIQGFDNNVSKVAMGPNHSALVTDDGNLYTWGENKSGQLGLKNDQNAATPQLVEYFAVNNLKVTSLALGEYHTAVVTHDGDVWTWGYGGRQQNKLFDLLFKSIGALGHGDMKNRYSPSPVKALRQLPPFKEIHCGFRFTQATNVNNELYMWGRGDYGVFGDGNNISHLLPTKNDYFEDYLKKKLHLHIVKLQSCNNYTVALMSDGNLYGWGSNENGQMGINSEIGVEIHETANFPTMVVNEAFKGAKIVDFKVAEDLIAILLDNNEVYWCGSRIFYKCEKLKLPANIGKITNIGVCFRCVVVVTEDGKIYFTQKYTTPVKENFLTGISEDNVTNLFKGGVITEIGGMYKNRFALVQQ